MPLSVIVTFIRPRQLACCNGYNKNHKNPNEIVLRTCIMLFIQKAVSKLPPFS